MNGHKSGPPTHRVLLRRTGRVKLIAEQRCECGWGAGQWREGYTYELIGMKGDCRRYLHRSFMVHLEEVRMKRDSSMANAWGIPPEILFKPDVDAEQEVMM